MRTCAMRALSICVLALAMATAARAQTPQETFARAMAQREQDTAPQQGYVRTALVTQARQDTAGSRPAAEGLTPPGGNPPPAFTPPVVVTPPLAGGIKPGHGFGDRNHTHQHRRGSRR